MPEEDVHGSSPSSLAASLPARNFTFWDPSQAGPSQDLFLARIIPENQGVNHTSLRTRSRAHGALRANSLPPGCCGQCSSGQLRAAQGSSARCQGAQAGAWPPLRAPTKASACGRPMAAAEWSGLGAKAMLSNHELESLFMNSKLNHIHDSESFASSKFMILNRLKSLY